MGFRMRGKKREKEEEKKIEVWVSKRVKKERFKKEEYKRERERCTFESLSLIPREHYDWEGAVGLGVSDLFVCVCLSVGLGVSEVFVCVCLRL